MPQVKKGTKEVNNAKKASNKKFTAPVVGVPVNPKDIQWAKKPTKK